MESDVPHNNCHPQEGSQDTEYQSHNSLGRKASRERTRRRVLALEIKEILRVGSGVARSRDAGNGACFEMIIRDVKGLDVRRG